MGYGLGLPDPSPCEALMDMFIFAQNYTLFSVWCNNGRLPCYLHYALLSVWFLTINIHGADTEKL